jgi:hypothetical protein
MAASTTHHDVIHMSQIDSGTSGRLFCPNLPYVLTGVVAAVFSPLGNPRCPYTAPWPHLQYISRNSHC